MPGVLIVEDEFLVALDLEDIIVQAGHQLVGVVADRRGIEGIQEGPSVALVDLNLRDGPTGPEIARRLAEQFGTRIIFVTANPDQINHPPATALGYIRKPFNPVDIVEAVALASGKAAARPKGLHQLH
ncbi:response regulator receiver domain-containing protein [Novosphingobium kunmingense]|uniref:Response regulator receiver domain-containing protein n=1 Tax=Novosphingobium kunmingense TaxID=1211806 RepID=A0A2N0HKH2_9SPHN|nr:response regulator [Novosphingobium kunmingense]PKB19368.1 response regulator receiver domain-containing protein [Novosphingobium kunmingense]